LSDIHVGSDIAEIAFELASIISLSLDMFLLKYATELLLSDPSSFLAEETGDMFGQVFVSVFPPF
jgi:hypothetical protein